MTLKRPKQERMSGILDAAVTEFLEKGYENSSVESIARRAGLSKGGIYHHFKSKDEILLYANQKLSEPVAEMMARSARLSSAAEALRSYIRSYLKYWKDRPQQLIFFFLSTTRVLANKDVWEMYEQYAEASLSFFQGVLDRGVQAGEFAAHDTRARALALMSALDGVIGYLMIDRKLKYPEVGRGLYGVFVEPVLATGAGKTRRGHEGRF